jgi:hypothetical protein
MGDLKFSSFYSISLRVSAFWKTWPPRASSELFDWSADIGVDEPTLDHSFQQAMSIPSFEVWHLHMVVGSRSSLKRYPIKITIAYSSYISLLQGETKPLPLSPRSDSLVFAQVPPASTSHIRDPTSTSLSLSSGSTNQYDPAPAPFHP